ncbi:hypothetical protein J3Q64DRAFT_1720622 [Phycomyces blakesleeanus]|uniref:Uncharacterized protein n=2 Tax=Phycomyces blakesleeanus TaxID=4837 RepID=A0A167P095_PHYB8|nr:hypothetical protein PHYBLDRAFT_180270 [Phycomyces blakesleeanus NRRL 1555(-)]OAD76991.1 hypothetical protein PHYBLDRAFT_180270 [Phycomyces blakesleeanus NRRL 1555(-)]|eukprot:XP_018295031.1 hypothetical protein PHYBLDRAFT_180270 [Phycomyces blakesleeanus NRRL 1555(-)]
MTPEQKATFEAFSKYDFDNDTRFQSGVSSLMNRYKKESIDSDDILERAQWFYYTKFVEPFDLDAFREWKAKKEADVDQEQKRFTFQELVEMIETGKEIPGIKQIPNTLNEGTPSQPKLNVRRKPWESVTE